ncbi:MAG: DUF4440 domain-containing protein [Actinotalea sp.]|nr:DUF4440 domain-containing protein [Actinotalea sp.]
MAADDDAAPPDHRAPHDDVLDLEVRGWEALSTDPDTATAFYRDVLDDDVVMLLPGGLELAGADAVLPTMAGAPWEGFALAGPTVRRPADGVALLTYRVTARRDGTVYDALISSLYVRRPEGWRLALHQHTPDHS